MGNLHLKKSDVFVRGRRKASCVSSRAKRGSFERGVFLQPLTNTFDFPTIDNKVSLRGRATVAQVEHG